MINIGQLMFIAFLPFPTAVLAEAFHGRSGEAVATVFYGGTMTMIGIHVTAMWFYAAHEHRLLNKQTTPAQARRIGRIMLIGPIGYAMASLVAFAVPWGAIGIFIGMNVFFL